MKRILIPTLFAFGSMYLAVGSLQAQTQVLYARVPFAFQAGQESHHAGEYRIAQTTNSQVVTLENKREMTVSNLGIATNVEQTKGAPRLVFHRYGDQYFLSEVWGAERQLRKMPVSRAERNIRDGETRTQAAVVSVVCGTATGL